MQSYSGLKYSLISGLCENSPSDASSKPDTAFIPKRYLIHQLFMLRCYLTLWLDIQLRQKAINFVILLSTKKIDIPLDLAHSSPKELGILFMEITISD